MGIEKMNVIINLNDFNIMFKNEFKHNSFSQNKLLRKNYLFYIL